MYDLFQTLEDLRIPFQSLTEIQLADILVTMSLGRSSTGSGGSCASTIKALRWLHRVAGVSILQVVYPAMINSFLIQKIPRDRKEAPPLPLWILVQWERRALMSACSTSETVLLGSFLLMAWASLRFSDAQRTEMARMVLTAIDLRGMYGAQRQRLLVCHVERSIQVYCLKVHTHGCGNLSKRLTSYSWRMGHQMWISCSPIAMQTWSVFL